LKKKLLLSFLVVLLLMGSGSYLALHFQGKPIIEVYFSPNGGCTEAITQEIDKAKYTIFVQAYSFTSAPIATSLVEAHKRGIETEVILDKSQKTSPHSSATLLFNSKVPTYIDARHAIAHNKIIIIDKKVVVSGSFNFTIAAEKRNAENLLILRSSDLAEKYIQNWKEHREHSEIYKPKL
jgi:phosphatidylserine/phosphatidylglycerophosphate/cardiolipin synthase-like enzyme